MTVYFPHKVHKRTKKTIGYEIWSLIPKEHWPSKFENRVLWKISGHKREEVNETG